MSSNRITKKYTMTFSKEIFENYNVFKEKSINKKRLKHADIEPIIKKYQKNNIFDIWEVGKSTVGRKIYLAKIGEGKTKIFLWSQMHGNESTGTQAIFDILNFFEDENFLISEKKKILENCKIYLLPMLNPDGAEQNKRRNEVDIDINRDARNLQSLEGQILMKFINEIKPDFGFNLHDQEKYYSSGDTKNTATISFLAPAFNFEKSVNESRKKSMQIILRMNEVLQNHIPNKTAKYFDDFMPSAFGDKIQEKGTSIILIESGYYLGDEEKQFVRKLNTTIILSAIKSISEKSYEIFDIANYDKIPFNKKNKFFDLLLRNCLIREGEHEFIADIGVRKDDFEGEAESLITDIGDLADYSGFQEIDAENKLVESEIKGEKIRVGNLGKFIIH